MNRRGATWTLNTHTPARRIRRDGVVEESDSDCSTHNTPNSSSSDFNDDLNTCVNGDDRIPCSDEEDTCNVRSECSSLVNWGRRSNASTPDSSLNISSLTKKSSDGGGSSGCSSLVNYDHHVNIVNCTLNNSNTGLLNTLLSDSLLDVPVPVAAAVSKANDISNSSIDATDMDQTAKSIESPIKDPKTCIETEIGEKNPAAHKCAETEKKKLDRMSRCSFNIGDVKRSFANRIRRETEKKPRSRKEVVKLRRVILDDSEENDKEKNTSSNPSEMTDNLCMNSKSEDSFVVSDDHVSFSSTSS